MIGQVTMPRITVVGQDHINYSCTVRNTKAVSLTTDLCMHVSLVYAAVDNFSDVTRSFENELLTLGILGIEVKLLS